MTGRAISLGRSAISAERQPALRPPPGSDDVPASTAAGGGRTEASTLPALCADEHAVNWSEELEAAARARAAATHFIDVWTRRAILARLGRCRAGRP